MPRWKVSATALWLGACSSTQPSQTVNRTQDQTSLAPQAATQATRQIKAAPVQAAGDEYVAVWTRPASPLIEVGHESTGELVPLRMGINRSYFFVDLQSLGVQDSEFVGKLEQPRIHLLVDGCPVSDIPVLPVLLPYDGKEARVVVARSSLPYGDLDMSFAAFGHVHTMLFANDKRGLRVIDMTERKDVVIVPGDPSKGISDTIVSIHRECPPG